MTRIETPSVAALVAAACATTVALNGIEEPGLTGLAVTLGVLGLVVAALRRPSGEVAQPSAAGRRSLAAVALACVVIAFLLPPWGAVAFATLGIGLVAMAGGRERWFRLGCGLAESGVLLVLLAGGIALQFRHGADLHEMPALARPTAAALGLFGLTAHAVAGDVVVPLETLVFRAIPDLAAFGLVPGLLLLAALAARDLVHRRTSAVRIAGQALLLIAALFVRYIALLLMAISSGSDRLFWSPWVLAATLLPIAWILAAVPRSPGRRDSGPAARASTTGGRRRSVATAGARGVLGGLGALLVAFGATAYTLGTPKAGRILIDEGHSGWERTDVALDTETYGQHTTYTYTTLARWLKHYYDVRTSEQPLTDAALADVDVLMLKVPTSPYAPEEIDAVERWVRNGGGLFLVGDHTNVFGSSDRLNPVAARFGMEFVNDAQYDLRTGGLTRWTPPPLGAHPVARSVPSFLFATGCTLRLVWPARPIQTGSGMRTFPADYSRDSFFCEPGKYHTSPAGLFHQSAAAEIGRGRVVAFTDSTVWSNFFVFVPGKPELALAMIHWLDHEEPLPGWRGGLVAAGLLLLGAAAWLARGVSEFHQRIGLLAVVGVGGAVGLLCGELSADRAAGLPAPRTTVPSPRFIANDADFFLPSDALTSDGPPAFTQFFNLSQRLGLYPRVDATWEDALNGRMAVWIRPSALPADHERESVERWIADGGNLLVLADSPSGAVTGAFLRAIGVDLRLEQATATSASTADAEDPPALRLAEPFREHVATSHRALERAAAAFGRTPRRIVGGQPWLYRGKDDAVIASATHGRGRVTVIAVSEPFANDAMGHSELAPDDEQRELFELTFALFRAAYGLSPVE